MLAGRKKSRNPTTSTQCLTIDNINQKFKTMMYVRNGPLHQHARAIERELQEGKEKPFEKVRFATLAGDRQQMGQHPITFVRQVMACSSYTALLDDPSFPSDVKERVKFLLNGCHGGNIGSYTNSGGLEIVRKHCADYISRRDGFTSDWTHVTINSGSAGGILSILKMFVGTQNGKQAAFLTPIPCSPIYSAMIAQLGMGQVGYHLDGDNNWDVNVEELKRSVDEAREKYSVRGIVIVNPGNPSGQIFPKETIEMMIRFAYEEDLFIIADEVYQGNVYDSQSPFQSVKKIIMQMGAPYDKNVQLASILSTSKGYGGESGIRMGCVEVVNMCPDVYVVYQKVLTVCHPSTLAQMALECLVNPPKEGEPSYPCWKKERDTIMNSLKERASFVVDSLRNIEGVTCNPIQGGMFAFPKLNMPEKAIEEAERREIALDVFYASELLENTGIVVEPGTEFGMPKQSCYLRTTILQEMQQMKIMLEELKRFHLKFLQKYANQV